MLDLMEKHDIAPNFATFELPIVAFCNKSKACAKKAAELEVIGKFVCLLSSQVFFIFAVNVLISLTNESYSGEDKYVFVYPARQAVVCTPARVFIFIFILNRNTWVMEGKTSHVRLSQLSMYCPGFKMLNFLNTSQNNQQNTKLCMYTTEQITCTLYSLRVLFRS